MIYPYIKIDSNGILVQAVKNDTDERSGIIFKTNFVEVKGPYNIFS